jgi:hypothetical protein
MKKATFELATLIIGMTFSLVLAGCASTGGTKDPTAAQAKQLAADINAIKAGKAKVNGATVTLTGWAGLQTALTVPAGATLDLTAEGAALELQDGAVLTVNGTVNATGHGDHGKGWVEGSLRVGDGKATINGSGTINLKSKGRLLNMGSDQALRQLTLDGVTLVGLSDNDSSLVGIHENGALVMKSGAITGNTRNDKDWASGGGVDVWHGTFTMEGGEISGNSASGKDGAGGGGVRIGEDATFTMSGGTISGNSVNSNEKYGEGGGVNVWKGTFIMEGGAISGNSAKGGEGASGGGVRVGEESVFTMTRGEISGNSATANNRSIQGGGVGVSKGTFTMEGGAITGNSARTGGGVVIDGNGTFTMEGGVISGNSAEYGGGLHIGGNGNGSTFIMKGGTIYGSVNHLPAGTNASLANSAGPGDSGSGGGAALQVQTGVRAANPAKWGTGGTYTIDGVNQTGGSVIVVGDTDNTLIAIPAK